MNAYDQKSRNCDRENFDVTVLEAQNGSKQGLQVAPDPELNTTTLIRIGHFDRAEACSASKFNLRGGILRQGTKGFRQEDNIQVGACL
jgi:hypothetical protein